MSQYKSGFIAIVGRPNVGKSTLLNAIVGQKISIVTPHPQTTRKRMLGIKTLPEAQVVFVDTPGLHKPRHELGAYMVREARESVRDVDAALFVVEPRAPGHEEAGIMELLRASGLPVVLVINKIDTLRGKANVLPVIEAWQGAMEFREIIPISAMKSEGVDAVLSSAVKLLHEGPKLYPDDIVTDSLERHIVAEIVREKAMLVTDEEVPHSIAVEIVGWDENETRIVISADIFVEKPGQKGIIIGKGGQRLKKIGSDARMEIERMLGIGVFLELFIKVRDRWRSDPTKLMDLGFGDRDK